MKVIKYVPEYSNGVSELSHKVQINPRYRDEVEIKVKNGTDVIYIKLTLGDLFNLIRTLVTNARL